MGDISDGFSEANRDGVRLSTVRIAPLIGLRGPWPLSKQLEGLLQCIENEADFISQLGYQIDVLRNYINVRVGNEAVIRVEPWGGGLELKNLFKFVGAEAERLLVERLRDNYRSNKSTAARKLGWLLFSYLHLSGRQSA